MLRFCFYVDRYVHEYGDTVQARSEQGETREKGMWREEKKEQKIVTNEGARKRGVQREGGWGEEYKKRSRNDKRQRGKREPGQSSGSDTVPCNAKLDNSEVYSQSCKIFTMSHSQWNETRCLRVGHLTVARQRRSTDALQKEVPLSRSDQVMRILM